MTSVNHQSYPTVLAHPFRPFFLLTGLYGTVLMIGWVGFLLFSWPLPLGWSPFKWHSHELIYGLVSAAAAGFLLTAMTNWTGAEPLRGVKLLGLVLCWVGGRAAMWMAGWLPGWLVAAADLIFLPVLAIYAGQLLFRHNNRRNLIMVAILALLAIGNGLMHIGFATNQSDLLGLGQALGFDVVTLMMIVIAGRITPAFSSNWLRNHGGDPSLVKQHPWIERCAIASVAVLIAVDLLPVSQSWVGALALLAAIFNGIRLLYWSGWKTIKEPLLWILHLAYLWIVIALLLRGISAVSIAVPASAWQHALGVGAIATLILGVMTRVTVGHTGRPLKLLSFGLLIYIFITGAALARILVALQLTNFIFGVTTAAMCWILAFGLFVLRYGPVLLMPRADGRPG